jgi:hypothetical protein
MRIERVEQKKKEQNNANLKDEWIVTWKCEMNEKLKDEKERTSEEGVDFEVKET